MERPMTVGAVSTVTGQISSGRIASDSAVLAHRTRVVTVSDFPDERVAMQAGHKQVPV
jgi:hypothetical protein